MKYLFALLSGFCLTLVVFGSGVGAAILYLSAEPVTVRSVDTAASEPRTGNQVRMAVPNDGSSDRPSLAAQDDRAGRLQAGSDIREMKRDLEPMVDPMTTATPSEEPSIQANSGLSADHVEWCSERYRSYDPSDNRYNAYSGARRACVSPYFQADSSADARVQETSSIGETEDGSSELMPNAYLDPGHVQSCFARYRSYRPEDNTYQPYGGGPRRQCE